MAVKLADSSKDLHVERHAKTCRDYHVHYGAMYVQRKDRPPKLPKVLVEWLLSYRTGRDGTQETRQVGLELLNSLGLGVWRGIAA